ncbi:MAG TPA: D-sedoheptulose 7-phosphate isomerase [Nitrospiria bacterium]
MKTKIKKEFLESAEVKRLFVEQEAERIARVTELMIAALKNGRKILFFGNGGSATDASHLAAELVNRFAKTRRALPAIALTTDLAVITSIGNDSDFSEIFSRQIEALGQRGDIAVAISTSGKSPNVLKGVEAARAAGLTVIAFTGGNSGALAKSADHAFIVPSHVTARIQETHITLGHVLCGLIEEAFAP